MRSIRPGKKAAPAGLRVLSISLGITLLTVLAHAPASAATPDERNKTLVALDPVHAAAPSFLDDMLRQLLGSGWGQGDERAREREMRERDRRELLEMREREMRERDRRELLEMREREMRERERREMLEMRERERREMLEMREREMLDMREREMREMREMRDRERYLREMHDRERAARQGEPFPMPLFGSR